MRQAKENLRLFSPFFILSSVMSQFSPRTLLLLFWMSAESNYFTFLYALIVRRSHKTTSTRKRNCVAINSNRKGKNKRDDSFCFQLYVNCERSFLRVILWKYFSISSCHSTLNSTTFALRVSKHFNMIDIEKLLSLPSKKRKSTK